MSNPSEQTALGRDLRPLLTSKDQTWNTPEWFIGRLTQALGLVGLDPCSNEWSVVRARTEYRLERGEDGLSLPWADRGLVFVNPPFGREIPRWMLRCETSGAEEVVALVPARVDAKWWHRAHLSCAAVILWRGRFAFRKRSSDRGNAPFPSSVFYWGSRVSAFVDAFDTDGIVLLGGGKGEPK